MKFARLDSEKHNVVEFQDFNDKMETILNKVQIKHDHLINQQESLENLVQKYIPLRILSMIIETTEHCFNPKQMMKLKDVAGKMNEILRSEILADKGNSTLKRVCLDFITRLRIDCNMLNEEKTAQAIAK